MPGEQLGVSLALNNPKGGLVIQLTRQDYEFIGWTPRYLVADILKSISQAHDISATALTLKARKGYSLRSAHHCVRQHG